MQSQQPIRPMKLLKIKINILLILALSPSGFASGTLTLDKVLQSTRSFYPKNLGMKYVAEKARAKSDGAMGNFDPKLSLKGEVQPTSFYQNNEVLAGVELPTRLWGTSFFAGWRRSQGKFPDYEGKRVTGEDGELNLGFNVPLLRGGPTDPERTEIEVANSRATEREAALDSAVLNSLLVASIKYWKWVESVQRLKITESLLEAAEERKSWINTRVKLGDIPALEAKDNERTILDRKTKVVIAEQELMSAALELSMYYRDEQGLPQVPNPDQAPKAFPEANHFSPEETTAKSSLAFKLRPELRQVTAKVAEINAELGLAETELLPTLDFYTQGSRDFGTVDVTRQGTELKAGLVFKIPLWRRKAKGQVAAASAQKMKLETEARLIRDQIKVNVSQSLAALISTFQQIKFAQEEVELNAQLVKGEQTRFKQGDSHIMFVNLRELNLVDSEMRLVKARSKHQQGLAHLLYVTGELANPLQEKAPDTKEP